MNKPLPGLSPSHCALAAYAPDSDVPSIIASRLSVPGSVASSKSDMPFFACFPCEPMVTMGSEPGGPEAALLGVLPPRAEEPKSFFTRG